ncbi:MAG: class II aldolase/adducin family protein [Candidatus Lokiarchaeota archaeon]|nr:class II aldolase/adducin family protein [Candidatus Lokiarchaeota archaeon]
METDKLEQHRKTVVRGAQEIYSKGLVEDGEGNVSVRINKNEILVTPTSTKYNLLNPELIVHMDLDGNVIGSGKIPSTEVKMHLAVYKDRPKVKCVIHNHSPYVSMLSVLRKSIPILMEQQLIFLGGKILCTEITKAHTDEMGTSALKALGRNNAAILANHGAIICGKSLDHTVRFSVVLEKMAKVYWGALQIGEPLPIPEKNLEEHEKMFNSLFACYPKRLRKS